MAEQLAMVCPVYTSILALVESLLSKYVGDSFSRNKMIRISSCPLVITDLSYGPPDSGSPMLNIRSLQAANHLNFFHVTAIFVLVLAMVTLLVVLYY
jgi:hypothetical protein